MGSAKFDVICHAPQVGVCGLNCKHCWVTDNLKQHKPLDEVKQMIDAMAELREQPVLAEKTILYFLDELTLHPQVIEILRYCRERNVLPQQFLVSNGLGIASRDNWKEILNELKKCGLKGFLMTISGDAEYHDFFTGVKGSFERTLTATRRANEFGFKVVWNMYLTNENVAQVVETARLKGDERFRISIPSPTTKWMNWHNIHPEIDILSEIPVAFQKFMIHDDYKTEAEWIDIILKDELPKSNQDVEKNKKIIKVGGYYECNGKLYTEITLPEYNVGSVNYAELRQLYSSYPIPAGVTAEKNIDMKVMALAYGNSESRKAFTLNSIKRIFIHNHSMNQSPANE